MPLVTITNCHSVLAPPFTVDITKIIGKRVGLIIRSIKILQLPADITTRYKSVTYRHSSVEAT